MSTYNHRLEFGTATNVFGRYWTFGEFLGQGRRILWNDAPPGSGTWQVGDLCLRNTGTSTSVGWRCSAAPNTWTEIGVDTAARTAVRRNSTGSTFTRGRINLIEGSNITIGLADDSGDDEVDVTITAAGGSGDSIQVNTVAVTDANLNDTTPAAPGDAVNGVWQRSGTGPDRVSVHLTGAGIRTLVLPYVPIP